MAPKILLVGDMPDAIESLPEWFKRKGYETLVATRGQALALAEQSRPNVILLDVMPPGMDGLETCRQLRMNPATSQIPVILVSAGGSPEVRAKGMQAGATDFVAKPIHFPDLLEHIERLVQRPQAMSPDHRRLLEEMAYTALAVLPCNLAWLVVVDAEKQWLVSQTVVIDRGADAARQFLDLVQGDQEEARFLLARGDNPLAEVVLNRTVLINIPVEKFRDLAGGARLREAFIQFRFAYISLLPLITSGRSVGALVLATTDARATESQRAQQILNSLSTQAAMVVDNARLLADLSAREAQMRAEQIFRQMVLDTMGEGLIVVDKEARITYVNNRLLLMTDHSRESLYGQSVGLLFHPASRDQLVASLTGRRRQTLPFSQKLVTKSGKEVPVLLSRGVAPAPDGRGQSTVMVVTDLTELQRHEEALRLQTQRVKAIHRAANAMSSASSLQEVVQLSLESALEVVQGVSASILLRDPDRPEAFVTVASAGPDAESTGGRVVKLGEGLVGRVGHTAESQAIADISRDEQVRLEYTRVYGPDAHSVVAVPLIAFDDVIGVLEVVNKTEGAFDEQDLETLESLAGSAAITIENSRLFDQEHRRVDELSTLLDASAAVTSTLDFGDILERIARRLSVALQVERVIIADWHRQSRQLITLAEVVNAYWVPGEGPPRRIEELQLTGAVFESGAPIAAAGSDYEDMTQPLVELNPSGLRAVAAFPIHINQAIIGAVALYSEAPQTVLPSARFEAVANSVSRWRDAVQAHDASDWSSRSNLTDLCQQVLQASGLRWCAVMDRDAPRGEIRLRREIGHALWLESPDQMWDMERYPSLSRVLESGKAVTLQGDRLLDDPNEQGYLWQVGGNTCLAAPLFIRGEPRGLVKLVDSQPGSREFDSAEVSLCQGIANVVGNAMENAQLYTAQRQRALALEAAYRELQNADEMKDDLLQNLSHELRTPLTHIMGYLRLMQDGAFGPLTGEQAEALDLVTNKAKHLADLVKDIVTVQEAEAHNLKPKPLNLEHVVALAVRSTTGRAHSKGIRIVSHIPTSLPLAYGDPGRVGEVFEELLENAIKFSPSSTQVEVTLEDSGGLMLHASVRDQGIGIAAEEQEKIFSRFYQVDSGTTRRYGGTGLGLAIVRQIVEAHSGQVWVESELGKGSSFHLTLPKASAITDGA
jgi:PAS domain S-box-containing protein